MPTAEPCHHSVPSDAAGAASRMTSSTAAPSVSIVTTTSAPVIAAAGSSATDTPCSTSGRALSVVRFHAVTSWPASARWRAIGAPMMPVPRKVILMAPGLPRADGAVALHRHAPLVRVVDDRRRVVAADHAAGGALLVGAH